MKKICQLLLRSLLLLLLNPGARAEAQTLPANIETMDAPYFIDGLHCEGIHFDKVWALTGEEKNRADKIGSQSYCEGLFRMYGIQQFQWYTSEQIENFQHAVRKSVDFEVEDLLLKKSTQPSHVHLIIKVRIENEKRFWSNYTHEVFGSKNGTSANATGFNVGVSIPENSRPFVWKLNASHYEFHAQKPLKEDPLWTPDQKLLNQSPSFLVNRLDINAGNLIPNFLLDSSIDLTYLAHNFSEGREMVFDSSVTWNLISKMAAEKATSYLGLMVDFSNAAPFYQTAEVHKNDFNRIGLLGGVEMGEEDRNYIGLKLRAFLPNGSQDNGMLAEDLRLAYAIDQHFQQIYFNLNYVSSLNHKNLDPGLRRRFAVNGRDSGIEVGANKWVNLSQGRLQINPFLGVDSQTYDVDQESLDSKMASQQSSNKGGLRLMWRTKNFDISGTLTYFESRVR